MDPELIELLADLLNGNDSEEGTSNSTVIRGFMAKFFALDRAPRSLSDVNFDAEPSLATSVNQIAYLRAKFRSLKVASTRSI